MQEFNGERITTYQDKVQKPEIIPPVTGPDRRQLELDCAAYIEQTDGSPEQFAGFMRNMVKLLGSEDRGLSIITPYLVDQDNNTAIQITDSHFGNPSLTLYPSWHVEEGDKRQEIYKSLEDPYVIQHIDIKYSRDSKSGVVLETSILYPQNYQGFTHESYGTGVKISSSHRAGSSERAGEVVLNNGRTKNLAANIFNAYLTSENPITQVRGGGSTLSLFNE